MIRRTSVLFAVWESGSILGRRNKDSVADGHSLSAVFAYFGGVVRSVGRSSDGNCDIHSSGRDEYIVGRTVKGWLMSCRVDSRSSRVLGGNVAVDGSVAGRCIVIDRSGNSRLILIYVSLVSSMYSENTYSTEPRTARSSFSNRAKKANGANNRRQKHLCSVGFEEIEERVSRVLTKS
jgi:hypothetical protein